MSCICKIYFLKVYILHVKLIFIMKRVKMITIFLIQEMKWYLKRENNAIMLLIVIIPLIVIEMTIM